MIHMFRRSETQLLCLLQASSSVSFPTPLLPACVRSSCGVLRREVRHLVSRVRLLAPPEFCKRPWSLLGPRGDGNGARSSPCPFSFTVCQMLSTLPVQFAVLGAAGHNGGGGCRETASRWDTRQEPGPQFNFKTHAVCSVSFNPQGQTSGLKGTVPRTGQPRLLTERMAGGRGGDRSTVGGQWGLAALTH